MLREIVRRPLLLVIIVSLINLLLPLRTIAECIEQQKLLASDAVERDNFGNGIAISGDWAVAGAPKHDGEDPGNSNCNSGVAYVYRFLSDSWVEWRQLVTSDIACGDWLGGAVAIDDDTVIVGAHLKNDAGTRVGAAYVFHRNHGGTNEWGEIRRLMPSDAASTDRSAGPFQSAVIRQSWVRASMTTTAKTRGRRTSSSVTREERTIGVKPRS